MLFHLSKLERRSKLWYFGLLPLFAVIIWGSIVAINLMAPQDCSTAVAPSTVSPYPPISQAYFDEPWIRAVAAAYGETKIPAAEFRDCYERFLKTKVLVPGSLCDISYREDYFPNYLAGQISETPTDKRLDLFRAHCLYSRYFPVAEIAFECAKKEYLGGALAGKEKIKIRSHLRQLEAIEAEVDHLNITAHVSPEFFEPLFSATMDCRAILDRGTDEFSEGFEWCILPELIKRQLPLPPKLQQKWDEH